MKLFSINCSILLALMLFSGKCLAFETADELIANLPKSVHDEFRNIKFDADDIKVANLLDACKRYLRHSSEDKYEKLEKLFQLDYPKYFIGILRSETRDREAIAHDEEYLRDMVTRVADNAKLAPYYRYLDQNRYEGEDAIHVSNLLWCYIFNMPKNAEFEKLMQNDG